MEAFLLDNFPQTSMSQFLIAAYM